MIPVKKILCAVALLLALGLLASCSSPYLSEDQVLSVRNRSSNKTISIGDTQAAVEKVTGDEAQSIMDFDFGMERFVYWDAEGLNVDYIGGQVVGLSIYSDAWDAVSGLRVGKPASEVESMYPGKLSDEDGYYYVGIGNDMSVLDSADDAPYTLIIRISEGSIIRINIEHTEILGPLQPEEA